MREKYSFFRTVWEQRKRHVVFVGVLLLIAGILGISHSWYFAPRLARLQDKQLRLQKEVRERQLEFARTGIPVSITEQIINNLQRFQALVPVIDEFSLFIGDLFSWAEQSGLNIHQINYLPEIDKEIDYVRYGLSFSVDGDYSEIKKFIYFLENTERVLIIENISLSGRETARNNKNIVSLNVQLATYFRREPV